MSRLKALERHMKHLKNAMSGHDVLFAPSFVGPDTYWTSAEKAVFFRSIARHSRWRPDLIAEDLGFTKSISDVWAYIQLLAEGSAAQPPLITSDSSLPSAREMSDEWIAAEEMLAKKVIDNEAQLLHHINLKARRGRLCALETSENLEDFNDQKKALESAWRRQDYLSKLNRHSLRSMDSLLRSFDDDYYRPSISNLEKNASSPEKKNYSRSPSVPDILDTEALHLSPASRRRLQKRLWARRKRCIESGASPSKASRFLGKLKRGRKFGYSGQDKKSAKKPSNERNIDHVQATDEDQSKMRQDVCGPYGITRTYLAADGLDIFHLAKFSVLSRWISESKQSELTDETTIAYDTLCYLRSSLIHFLTLVIGEAIALRRADFRQTRVNGDNLDADEIRRENIVASLSSLGRSVDKNIVIGRLYATLRSGCNRGVNSRVENQSETLCSARLSSEITAATSFSLLADSREPCFVPSISMSTDDGNIVVEDVHQRDWSKELAAEEALEKKYKHADRNYETRLWRCLRQDCEKESSHRRSPVQSKVFADGDGDTNISVHH